MSTKSPLFALNHQAFNQFVKLSFEEKIQEIKEKALLVDLDLESNFLVNLYFLQGFFIEEIVCIKQSKTLEIIPFMKGFKPEQFIKVEEVVVPRRKIHRIF